MILLHQEKAPKQPLIAKRKRNDLQNKNPALGKFYRGWLVELEIFANFPPMHACFASLMLLFQTACFVKFPSCHEMNH